MVSAPGTKIYVAILLSVDRRPLAYGMPALTSNQEMPRLDDNEAVSEEAGTHTSAAVESLHAGSAEFTGRFYRISVLQKPGFLFSITSEGSWPVDPSLPFNIFGYTEPQRRARVMVRQFGVAERKRCTVLEPGLQEMEVEHTTDIDRVWRKSLAMTRMVRRIDTRNPHELVLDFAMTTSDAYDTFKGRVVVSSVRDEQSGQVVGARMQLSQDICPRGIPGFVARIPLMNRAIRGKVFAVYKGIYEDIDTAIQELRAEMLSGHTADEALAVLCAARNGEPGNGRRKEVQQQARGPIGAGKQGSHSAADAIRVTGEKAQAVT